MKIDQWRAARDRCREGDTSDFPDDWFEVPLKRPPAATDPICSPEQFASEMQAIADQKDPCMGHAFGDELLLRALESLGYGEGAAIFRQMTKWYE